MKFKLSLAMSAILGASLSFAAPNDTQNSAQSANQAVNSTQNSRVNSANSRINLAAVEDNQNAQSVNSPARQNATRNSRANSAAKANSAKNSANLNANSTSNATKTSAARVYEQRQHGLMPSELDRFNHNVFYADAEAIRGARDTESALRYIPFVTIVNTAGFGQAFDFRGQGRVSSNGVKFFINGIAANPLDSYYGFMPINSILPNLIQEIKVYPGSGAVLYGSGAKGAIIDVITSKRQTPYFSIGAGYVNTSGADASYFVHTHAAEKVGILNLNAGLGYSQKGGPREDDNTKSGEIIIGAQYDFGLGKILDFDFDMFLGKMKGSPYNSFWDNDGARLNPNSVATLPEFNPESAKEKSGDGDIDGSQTRLTTSIAYQSDFTERLKWDIKAYYSFDSRKYDTYTAHIPYFVYGGTNFVPSADGTLHTADQSGSKFSEHKFGGRIGLDYAHLNGDFIAGIDSFYEKSNRRVNQILKSAPQTSSNTTEITIKNQLDMGKFTNAVFLMENYRLTQNFSLEGGLRYELTKYTADSDDYILGTSGTNTTANPNLTPVSYEKNTGNFTFELTPTFRYSDTGVIYGRFERGYTTLPPYALSNREGALNLTNMTHDFRYTDSNLKDETYNTFELGFKDSLGQRNLPLGIFDADVDGLLFSINAFYTSSKNEFFFTGDPYSGLAYDTYDSSRRYGGEIALEQYLFNGAIGLNESFTYVKAQGKQRGDGEGYEQIPYTYDYKATLGAFFNASAYVEIVDVSLGVWIQNSFYGGQAVPYLDRAEYAAQTQANPNQRVKVGTKKLDPYIVSDFGISLGFNKNAAVITTGIKNVFNEFYYDYYNHDVSAAIGEYRYLVGQGRTVFVEVNYKY